LASDLLYTPNRCSFLQTLSDAFAAHAIDSTRRSKIAVRRLGVAFTREPKQEGPVMTAVFSDTCGNLIMSVQP
jgi:hypothetical protein